MGKITGFGKGSKLQEFGSGTSERRKCEPVGKRPLGRPSRKWKENITGVIKEIGCEGVFGIHLALDRYQWRNAVGTAVFGFHVGHVAVGR